MKVRIVRIASLAIALSLTVVSGLSAQTKSAPAQKAAAPKAGETGEPMPTPTPPTGADPFALPPTTAKPAADDPFAAKP